MPSPVVLVGPDSIAASQLGTWTCTSKGNSRTPNVYFMNGRGEHLDLYQNMTDEHDIKYDTRSKNTVYDRKLTLRIHLPTDSPTFNLTCCADFDKARGCLNVKKTKIITVYNDGPPDRRKFASLCLPHLHTARVGTSACAREIEYVI